MTVQDRHIRAQQLKSRYPEKTAETALEESRARPAEELEATELLQTISTELVQAENVEALYERLVEAAARLMGSDFSTMQMLHPERGKAGELELLAFRGFDSEVVKFWEWVRADSGCTCGMALRTGKRAIAEDVETCEWMAGTVDQPALLAAGVGAAQSTPLVSRSGRLLGMISTHWRKPHAPSESELKRFDILARQAADLIERAQAAERLRRSEARFRAIIDQVAAGLAETDLEGRIILANPRFCEMVGRTEAELLSLTAQEITHPEDRPAHADLFSNLVATGSDYVIEKRYLRKDGTPLWVRNSVCAIGDGDGRLTHAVAVSIDITEGKQAQEQQTLLLREMNHRVKNLFAITSGLVSLSARSALTPGEMAASVRERLNALSRAHELTRPGVTGMITRGAQETTLHALVGTIFAPYASGRPVMAVEGADAAIGAATITSMALVMHELATNAAKYGALALPGGAVDIHCAVEGERFELHWKERGGPPLDGEPQVEGFGGTLTRRVIEDQFGGTIARSWEADGLRIRLSIPLQHLGRVMDVESSDAAPILAGRTAAEPIARSGRGAAEAFAQGASAA
ncbi:MAG: PAS domain S-box protein [Caulobacteraceae bacterium]